MPALAQKIVAVALLMLATAAAAALWSRSSLIAFLVFFAILAFHGVFLAFQFTVLAIGGRNTEANRPSARQLVWAWAVETVVSARVFLWQQAFRSHAVPDEVGARPGARGLVFVHGFLCNRGLWNNWMAIAHDRSIPFIAVNLEPTLGSIDEYSAILDRAVREITRATGAGPLLVCHSMGGLVARAWMRNGEREHKIHHVVTIASPHSGTTLGHSGPRLSTVINGEQMRVGSPWLRALAKTETAQRTGRFTCFYSNCDNIVIPASAGRLPGADNRIVLGVPHLAMVFNERVIRETLALL